MGNRDAKLSQPGPSSPPARRRTTSQRGVIPTSMTRLTVNLSTDLVDRLRDTVYGVSHVTLSGLVAHAIGAALTQLESDHGGRFPRRAHELKAGRPRKKERAQTSISLAVFRTTNDALVSSFHSASGISDGLQLTNSRQGHQTGITHEIHPEQ